MTARGKWMTYVRGWTHGAKVGPMDAETMAHIEAAPIYEQGYRDGRAARNAASNAAAAEFGYEIEILRLASDEKEAG